MKRFFCILPCLALLICLMPFSASAASSYEFTTHNGGIDAEVDAGTYTMSIYEVSSDVPILVVPDFSGTTEECILYDVTTSFSLISIFICFFDGDFHFETFGFTPEDASQELIVVLEPVGMAAEQVSFLGSVSLFFDSVISWTGTVALLIVTTPSLLIGSFGVVILGCILFYVKKLAS